jgi:hypothetical protein
MSAPGITSSKSGHNGRQRLVSSLEKLSLSDAHEPTSSTASLNHSVLLIFEKLKQERDLAKVVKSDDAEVPVDLWDKAVWKGGGSDDEKKVVLSTIRWYILENTKDGFGWTPGGTSLKDMSMIGWGKSGEET